MIVGDPVALVGPLIGAVVITSRGKVVSTFTEPRVMALVAVYVVTALGAPRGTPGLPRAAR